MPDRKEPLKKMTVMCFFGSDNALSPLLISQVKAIKDAGFEKNTNLIVRFDPNEPTAPTRLYNVNAKRLKAAIDANQEPVLIGDGPNPYVRNMAEDIIEADKIKTEDRPMSKAMQDELNMVHGQELEAFESLRNFVGYCIESHPAEQYILFLIGHGMIVGNDAFLPDDNPNSGISLEQLSEILAQFRDSGGSLELLGLHSCSMSSVEIAYQLKGIANYLIASQGPSFVGSWPYRQLLKKILDTVHETPGARLTSDAVQQLVEKLYLLSLYNSTDFMMAGYSSDIALCNLQPAIIDDLTGSLEKLTTLFMDALGSRRTDGSYPEIKNGQRAAIRNVVLGLISKAHAESQSYWGESYTDLYDFCDCLLKSCEKTSKALPEGCMEPLMAACTEVRNKLETLTGETNPSESETKKRRKRFNRLVVRSEYFGWKFQYSHGLSVYFPWAEPLDCENISGVPFVPPAQPKPGDPRVSTNGGPQESIMARYQAYEFTRAFENGPSWFDFLNAYFARTQRELRNGKPPADVLRLVGLDGASEFEQAKAATIGAFLDHKAVGEQGPGDNKPTASVGIDNTRSSIKNFFTEKGRNKRKIRAFSISPGAVKAFKEPVPVAVPDKANAAQQSAD